MHGHCEKHGTAYRLEEVRDHSGKTVEVCDACQADRSVMAAFIPATPIAIYEPATRPWRRHGRRLAVIAAAICLALLSAFLAQPASAQDFGGPGWGNLSTRWGSYAYVQYHASQDAPDLAPRPGTRLQGSVTITRILLAGRLDMTAATAGSESWSSIEGHVLGAVRIAGPVAIAGTWGYVRPAFGDDGQELEIYGGGVFVGRPLDWDGGGGPWLYLGAAQRRSMDPAVPLVDEPRWRLATAFQVPIKGDKTSATAEALLGRGWAVKAGVAVRLK